MDDTPLSELIFKKYHWMASYIMGELKQADITDLTRTQAITMAAISQGEYRPSHIATQLGISRQAVHKTLKELQQQGLVAQCCDPEHKKAVKVNLTEKGEDIHSYVQKISSALEKRIVETFGKDASVLLKKMLAAQW